MNPETRTSLRTAYRVAARERSALSAYRVARNIYLAHRYSDAYRRSVARSWAIHYRAIWTTLHDIQRDPAPRSPAAMAAGIDAGELATLVGAA